MRKFFDAALTTIALAVIVAIMGIVWFSPSPIRAQSTALGPNIYAYTAITTSQVIIGANPTRKALQICNPGGTNVLWIAPQNTPIGGNTGAITTVIVPSANGAGTVGVPVTSAGTVPCYSPPVNAPSIGAAWAAFSTTTPATVYEWP